ncbi:hypothetical protein [Chroococcidiopsis cubana]|uniref:hypothetical protein n=1 Tax=Chroococcidiopsis cubana TaxID=171392 RepID=UPI00131585FE|nr:hypothetical protein [Chroococcidiopsis cubana]
MVRRTHPSFFLGSRELGRQGRQGRQGRVAEKKHYTPHPHRSHHVPLITDN